MDEDSRRRNTIVLAVLALLIILALLLLLTRCLPKKSALPEQPSPTTLPVSAAAPKTRPPAESSPAEVLAPATLNAPARVTAGATLAVTWTGPDNPGDYITIVRPDAATNDHGHYQETRHGAALELVAPIEPGPHEVRYVTGASRTILGRATIDVLPAGATLDAPDEVVLGSTFSVAWTGPNNKGDYVTIVPKTASDGQYGSYTDADKPSPQTLTAPSETGEAEVRYITGQDNKVLARRAIQVIAAAVSLSAPGEAIAGTTIQVAWTGPNNAGDYITLVTTGAPDNQYGNYTNTSSGSPLKLLSPIMSGNAELRYVTGQGHRVLARRPINIVAAKVTLAAPAEGPAGSAVSITWTGPNNPGDYITIVPKATPDGQYGHYATTDKGSPLSVNLPKDAGDAEVRYMTGQGNKVLARMAIRVLPSATDHRPGRLWRSEL
jgi:Ca-activated chloride channel family protein